MKARPEYTRAAAAVASFPLSFFFLSNRTLFGSGSKLEQEPIGFFSSPFAHAHAHSHTHTHTHTLVLLHLCYPIFSYLCRRSADIFFFRSENEIFYVFSRFLFDGDEAESGCCHLFYRLGAHLCAVGPISCFKDVWWRRCVRSSSYPELGWGRATLSLITEYGRDLMNLNKRWAHVLLLLLLFFFLFLAAAAQYGKYAQCARREIS